MPWSQLLFVKLIQYDCTVCDIYICVIYIFISSIPLYIIIYQPKLIIITKYISPFQQPSQLANKMDQLNEIQQLYNRIPKQVIAKFTTKLIEYNIDATEIDIPTEMDEHQCNKLLKQFLEQNVGENIVDSLHFEFLVGGKLLRGQLKSHIIRYEISCQQTLNIEYFLAFQPLDHQLTLPQDDWISTLQLIPHPLGNLIVAGLFNGQATFLSNKNNQIFKMELDEDCIKAIKLLPTEEEDKYYVISGGVNEEIKVSLLGVGGDEKVEVEVLSTTEVEGAVLGLDVNPLDDGHFCTATNTGTLLIHKIPHDFLTDCSSHNQSKKLKKKRHLNQPSLSFITKQTIHKDAITALNWITQDRIITGSADHSMKLIDVEKMRQVGVVLTKDSITTAIQYSNERLLTSHEDGFIRLWDVRVPQMPTNTYKAHSKLVSSVEFNPNKGQVFCSVILCCYLQGSYDTTVKVWDMRSSFPLQNIGTHHDKVFSVIWKHQTELVAAGADSKISVHYL